MEKYFKLSKTELYDFLIKCSEEYYNSGNKVISDSDFDKLKDYYESKYNTKLPIGAKVNVKNTVSVKHNYTNLAGTLSKVNTIDELKEWIKLKKLTPNDKFICSLKIDGNAIVFEYSNNKLNLAVTRGEEGVVKI